MKSIVTVRSGANNMKKYIYAYALVCLSVYLIIDSIGRGHISIVEFLVAKVIELAYFFSLFLLADKLLASKRKFSINKHLFYGAGIFIFILLFGISNSLLPGVLQDEISLYLDESIFFQFFLLVFLYFSYEFYTDRNMRDKK